MKAEDRAKVSWEIGKLKRARNAVHDSFMTIHEVSKRSTEREKPIAEAVKKHLYQTQYWLGHAIWTLEVLNKESKDEI